MNSVASYAPNEQGSGEFEDDEIHEMDSQDQLELQQRSEGIGMLVTNLKELGEIFQELNTLVVEQGTILDRIDYNVEMAQEHTEKAVEQLHKAEKHQKSMRSTW